VNALGEMEFTEMYMMTHAVSRATQTNYKRIHLSDGGPPLDISAFHNVKLASGALKPPIGLKRGDKLLRYDEASGSMSPVAVTRIESVKLEGAYHPMTWTRTIVVNGVVASDFQGLPLTPAVVEAQASAVMQLHTEFPELVASSDSLVDADTGLHVLALAPLMQTLVATSQLSMLDRLRALPPRVLGLLTLGWLRGRIHGEMPLLWAALGVPLTSNGTAAFNRGFGRGVAMHILDGNSDRAAAEGATSFPADECAVCGFDAVVARGGGGDATAAFMRRAWREDALDVSSGDKPAAPLQWPERGTYVTAYPEADLRFVWSHEGACKCTRLERISTTSAPPPPPATGFAVQNVSWAGGSTTEEQGQLFALAFDDQDTTQPRSWVKTYLTVGLPLRVGMCYLLPSAAFVLMAQRKWSAAQLREEVSAALSTWLAFALELACLLGASLLAWDRATLRAAIPHSLSPAAQVADFTSLVLAHDAWFFATHWAMHATRGGARVHARHHAHGAHFSPLAAIAFGPAEALLQALYLPLVTAAYVAALGRTMHPNAWRAEVALAILHSVWIHSGADRWCGARVCEGLERLGLHTPRLHRAHHDAGELAAAGNYALYFTHLDHAFGTARD